MPSGWTRALLLGLTLSVAACASRAPVEPPVPVAPKHPDFVFPTVADGGVPDLATRIDRGWRYLQADDLRSAEREFQAAVKAAPGSAAPAAALGYVELAHGDFDDAIARFDQALATSDAYVPALVGQGQAFLGAGREDDALPRLERALLADPSLASVAARVQVLRVRALQDNLERARVAFEASRWDDARAAYRQALAASPDSAFLYRDLGIVERRAGRLDEARTELHKALELDANDARAHAALGAVLDASGDPLAALAAYEKAAALDPGEVEASVLAAARDRAALARLPAEYRAIPQAEALTRADLAALLGVRLQALLATLPTRQVVITDVRGHWAQPWISALVRAGVMETLPNYTFEPGTRVRRGELADTLNRVLDIIARTRPAAAARWRAAVPTIADVPPRHLAYRAVTTAVASGVMRLRPDGTFQLLAPVTGAEAVEIVSRLEALSAS